MKALTVRQEKIKSLIKRAHSIGRYIDYISDKIAPRVADADLSPMLAARTPILVGTWSVIIIFGFFGLWSAIAPLDSAAVAPGQVILDTNRKTIQHLEGGIIDEILVKEGMHVKKGQALVRLNPISAGSRLDLFKGQYDIAKGSEARLLAERDGKSEVTFSPQLLARKDVASVAEIIDSQRRLFIARRNAVEGQVKVLNQKIEQYKREISGLAAQENAAAKQIAFLQEEIDVVRKLLKEGNAMKPRLLGLERAAAELEGKRGENVAFISRSEQSIAEAELAIGNTKNEFMNKVVAELKDVQSQLSDLDERLRASTDIMDRVVISAPQDGIITGLNVHTVGGVIPPGGKVMDIVPLNDKLVVEAQVLPQDIDVVRNGLTARVRLSAYKSRTTPIFKGEVVNVSADKFVEERNGHSYYLARVEIDPSELAKYKDIELSPGMPADVLIVTGQRTLLGYLFSPIHDSFSHAFREE